MERETHLDKMGNLHDINIIVEQKKFNTPVT